MSCRCGSTAVHAQREAERLHEDARAETARLKKTTDARIAELASRTPNPDEYVVEHVQRIGAHLVLQVRYPNCRACAYEGLKTLVLLNVTEYTAMKWRRIDPHFRGPTKVGGHVPTEAPSPAARFPGNPEGLADACAYARGKAGGS